RVPMLEIGLADGSVRAQGQYVTLSDREHALLTALSLRREVVPRARLAALLWPELDDYAARNALSVCLHRLRAHLGTDEAIVRSKDGYALNDGARVDLWEFDRLATTLRGRSSLAPSELRALQSAHVKLRERRPDRMGQWEWFEPAERHLCELRLEVAHRLALDALAREDASAALDYAEEMIGYDPCDESARQIAIRAHLAIGDKGAALRHYRQYRDTLAAELQVEPSQEIKVLVGLP
ncbi:MAG TPA: BTAD domain-containing putative transcriptional regulator, partial [Candidatus Baltobacteraceae bacterium]|nr:BTAD domain-containing putative transcriptional regulator [Candidatus Baltobacteraceae bacterium]